MLLSPSVTIAPPFGAGPLKPTVQVDDPCEDRMLGLQLNNVKLTGPKDVIVPPVATVGIARPAVEVLTAFVTPIMVLVALAETVTLTTAATPFWMVAAFSPVSKHV